MSPAGATEPSVGKAVSLVNADRNGDGTFPSGGEVNFDVTPSCSFTTGGPSDCNSFDLRDTIPTFTDIDGATAKMVFVGATNGGVPVAAADDGTYVTIDDWVAVFGDDSFDAGDSALLRLTFRFPPGITPDNTIVTNQAQFGVFDGGPVSAVAEVVATARAKTAFDTRKTGPASVEQDTDATYTVQICNVAPADPYFGPLDGDLLGATLTDTLPPEAQFVSASANNATPTTPAVGSSGTVSWDFGDVTIPAATCLSETVTIRFTGIDPADLVPPLETSNDVEAGGTPPAGSEFDTTASRSIEVVNPTPGVADVAKSASRGYVDLDDADGEGDSVVTYSITPANTGGGTILDATLTDTIPDHFAVTSISLGTWASGPTGPSNDGDVRFTFDLESGGSLVRTSDGTAPTTVTTPDIDPTSAATTVVDVTVEYGDVPADWDPTTAITLTGYFIDPGRSGGTFDLATNSNEAVPNTACFGGTTVDALGDTIDTDDCATVTVRVEDPQPHVSITKAVTSVGNRIDNDTVRPSSADVTTTLTWAITIRNLAGGANGGTAVLPDPVIADLVPVLTGAGLSAPYNFTATAPAGVNLDVGATPGTDVTDDTQDRGGEQLLLWEFSGDLALGEAITVTFDTDVAEFTPPQSFTNDAWVTTNALDGTSQGQRFTSTAGSGTWQTDVDDVDDDTATDDQVRRASRTAEIVDFVVMSSEKLVAGPNLPSEPTCEIYGDALVDNVSFGLDRCTRPGDRVDYRVVLTNDGNVPLEDIVVIDLFPRVGDTFIVPNQTTGAVSARGSEFDVNLVGEIDPGTDPLIIEYTTVDEPCRGEDFYPTAPQPPLPSPPGCQPAGWTTDFPTPSTDITGVRITYDGILAVNDSFDFTWPMRATTSAAPLDIATNAFGWAAKSTVSDARNRSAPPPVDVQVQELLPLTLGDFVWFDYDYAGDQDLEEDGVAGVPVGLFVDEDASGGYTAGDTLVSWTVTDDPGGDLGRYIFNNLPEGKYVLVFAPPTSYVVSPKDATDDASDSDIAPLSPIGTTLGDLGDFGDFVTALGSEYEELWEVPVDLTESDITFDAGLWRPDPAIDITKFVNGEDANVAPGVYVPFGLDVGWTFDVTNTGNVVLENVTLNDGDLETEFPGLVAIDCPETTLYPASQDTADTPQTMTCLALVDGAETVPTPTEGVFTNVADVTADPVLPEIPWDERTYDQLVRIDGSPYFDGDGNPIPVTDSDPANVFGAVADIDIEKATNGVDADTAPGFYVEPGETITWTYVVTIPAGANVGLDDIVIVDDAGTPGDTGDDLSTGAGTIMPVTSGGFNVGDTDTDGILDLDETWQYEAGSTASAQEGQYSNEADVSGRPVTPDGVPIENPDSTLMERPTDADPSNYFGAATSIDVEKATNDTDADDAPGPFVAPGSTVTWTYVVTNTGNVDLADVAVTDDRLDDTDISCDASALGDTDDDNLVDLLGPDESVTCTATADAVEGVYENLAGATGDPVDPDGAPIGILEAPTDEDPSHYFGYTPSVDIEKATNGTDADGRWEAPIAREGSTVTWTYVVTNTGNVALTGVVVSDDVIAEGDISCAAVNDDAGGDNVVDLLVPGQSVTCSATGIAVEGLYENLSDVEGQPAYPSAPGEGFDPADPGTYPSDPADYGDIVDDDSGEVSEPVVDDDPSHYFTPVASIDIEKSTNGEDADNPSGPVVAPGSSVTWTYVVTNTGNVALSAVVVSDDRLDGAAISCDPVNGDAGGDNVVDLLLPGQSVICTASAPAVVGSYENLADVIGSPALPTEPDPSFDPSDPATYPTDPGSYGPIIDPETETPFDDVTDEDPSHYFGGSPAIDIEKSTNGEDADSPTGPELVVGETVTWTYVVTNTGNTNLFSVTVTDNQIPDEDISCDPLNDDDDGDNVIAVMTPGETVTCVATGVVVEGQYANMATVGAMARFPLLPVRDSDPSHYVGVVADEPAPTPSPEPDDAVGPATDTPDDPQVAPGPDGDVGGGLAFTGASPLAAVTLAAILIATGLALFALGRRRRRLFG